MLFPLGFLGTFLLNNFLKETYSSRKLKLEESIENLLENYEKIKQQKRRETIRDSRKNILISKELVTLKRDVDNIPALNDLVKKEISVETLVPFLDELELKKLSEKIEKDVYKFLDPMASISAKTSIGGTAPSQVKKQIFKAKMDLKI